jgi:transmembrane sensor
MKRPEEQMRELVAAQALEWFLAHRSATLAETQREEFIDWLRASPEHAREYLALTGFIKDFGLAAKSSETSAEVLVARARAELDAAPAVPLFPAVEELPEDHRAAATSSRSHRTRVRMAATAVAAMTAFVLLFGAWWLRDRTVYSTAHAEQRSWRMPDGSTVHLNSSSEIEVHFDAGQREVELIRGQALFQVAKDASRPFRVHTGDAIVKAVGTEFDIYRQPRRTLISVVEGRVAIWRLQRPEAVEQLDAGQQARITRESTVVSKRAADVRKTVAWLQRQVVFDHDPLGNAVEEFNRYAELRIRIDDSSLREVEISGIFSAYDAESFIRFLEHQPEMQLRRAGKEIVVTAAASASEGAAPVDSP